MRWSMMFLSWISQMRRILRCCLLLAHFLIIIRGTLKNPLVEGSMSRRAPLRHVELSIRKAAKLEVDQASHNSTVSALTDSLMKSGIISDADVSFVEYADKLYLVGSLSQGQINSLKKLYPDVKHALVKGVGLTASVMILDVKKDSDSGSSLFSEAGGDSVKE